MKSISLVFLFSMLSVAVAQAYVEDPCVARLEQKALQMARQRGALRSDELIIRTPSTFMVGHKLSVYIGAWDSDHYEEYVFDIDDLNSCQVHNVQMVPSLG